MTTFVGGPGDDGNTFAGGFSHLLMLPVVSHSSTKIVLDAGGVLYTFKGTGFANFDMHGFPGTGTITSIVGTEKAGSEYPGSNDVSVSHFSMSVEDVVNYVNTDDRLGFLNALYAGNDTFTSNNHSGDHAATNGEIFQGFAGNDTFNVQISGGGEILDGGDGKDTFNFGASLLASDQTDGGAGTDTLTLAGDYSSGLYFNASTMVNVEKISLGAGHSYHLVTDNGNIAAGQMLTVDGGALGASDSLVFNGSGEIDGKLKLIGGDGNDTLTGGAGKDTIIGGGRADILTGGASADVFAFAHVSDSIGSADGGAAGSGFDTITDLDAKKDKIDLPFAVAGVDAPIAGGAVHQPLFDTDLGNALTSLGAYHAVLFTTAGGDYNGHKFLVIDANGTTGYQAGDMVIDVTGATHLSSLAIGTFI